MKNLKVTLMGIALSLGHFLGAKTINVDATGAAITVSSGLDAKVLPRDLGQYRVHAFDRTRNMLYLAEAADTTSVAVGAPVSYRLIRVSFDQSGNMNIMLLGGVTDQTGFFDGMRIRQLELTQDGHLVIVRDPSQSSGSGTKFAVLKNPYADALTDMQLVISSAVTDSGSVASKVSSICCVGKDANGFQRIMVAIPAGANTETANEPQFTDAGASANHCLKNFIFNHTAGTLTEEAGVTPASLNTVSGAALGAITGVLSKGVKYFKMTWDNDLGVLYLAPTIKAASSSSVEHSYVVIGRFAANGQVTLSQFAPPSNGTAYHVLGVKGHTVNYSIPFVKTLSTATTGSKYLIAQVQHNNAVTDSSANFCVYSYPITDASSTANGAHAKIDSVSGLVRSLDATTPAECFTNQFSVDPLLVNPFLLVNSGDVRSLVGGGPLPAGENGATTPTGYFDNKIRQVNVIGDTVYATCVTTDATTTHSLSYSGVYASNPIYDIQGDIQSWTPWTRVFSGSMAAGAVNAGSNTEAVIHAVYLTSDGYPVFVAGSRDGARVNVVGRADWKLSPTVVANSSASALVSQVITDYKDVAPWFVKSFPMKLYNLSTLGTLGTSYSDLSIIGGRGAVSIVCSGASATGAIAGAGISAATHYKKFDCAGDVLCAEMTRLGQGADNPVLYPLTHGFIFVGTTKGLYVLRKDSGAGFNAKDGVSGASAFATDLSAALSDMTFQQVPGFAEPVHALHATQKYLYVMTTKSLKRIRLHSNSGELFSGATGTNSYDVACTMFASAAPIIVDASVNLMATPEDTTKLVVQNVMSAAGQERFVNMVGAPNNSMIYLASIVAGKTRIYPLYGNDPVVTISTNTDVLNPYPAIIGVLKDSKVYSYNGYVRNMVLRTINYQNPALNDTNNGLGYLSNTTGLQSLFVDTVGNNFGGVVANLVLLMGEAMTKKTSIKILAITGACRRTKFKTGVTGSPNFDFFDNLEGYVAISSLTSGNASNLSVAEVELTEGSKYSNVSYSALSNAVDASAVLSLFGSSYASRPIVSILSSKKLSNSSLTAQNSSELAGISNAYNVDRLANGSLIMMSNKGPKLFE